MANGLFLIGDIVPEKRYNAQCRPCVSRFEHFFWGTYSQTPTWENMPSTIYARKATIKIVPTAIGRVLHDTRQTLVFVYIYCYIPLF